VIFNLINSKVLPKHIDPYPGIATTHTLKNGVHDHLNPTLMMFQGAVGRAFHKLYEPYMSYKDEVMVRTVFKPKFNKKAAIKSLTGDKKIQNKIEKLLE
tara:strand:- start:61 stop:357 length:297 start_codon:yes stop_codon:yes gene_type:complete